MSNENSKFDQKILFDNFKKIRDYAKDNNKLSFDNLITFNSSPNVFINLVTAMEREKAEPLLKIEAAQVATLVPTIKLWHVNSNGERIQIYMKDYYDEDLIRQRRFFRENERPTLKAENKAVEEFFTESVSSGLGIKSINIQNRPENPGDVNITCKIDMHFDDIVSLMQGPHVELFKVPKLIQEDVNPLDFRIQVLLGWAVPHTYDKYFTPQLREAIKETQQIYYCALVQHDLNFNQDGSISLSLEYQSGIESVFYSPRADILNILNLVNQDSVKQVWELTGFIYDYNLLDNLDQDELDQYYQPLLYQLLRERIKFLVKELQEIDRIDETYKNTEDRKKELEEFLEKSRSLLQQVKKNLRKEQYSNILKKIIAQSRMYYLQLPASPYMYETSRKLMNVEFGLFNLGTSLADQSVNPLSSFIKVRELSPNLSNDLSLVVNEISNRIIEGQIDTDNDLETSILETPLIDDSNLGVFSSLGDILQSGVTPIQERLKKAPPYNTENSEKYIHFMFLGDIINVVSSFVNDDGLNDHKIILGPVQYEYQNKTEYISIAEIPIPLEKFTYWFTQKAVRKNKDKWYFKEFIKDIINDLVTPYIFGRYQETGTRPYFQLNTNVIFSPNEIKNGTRFTQIPDFKGILRNSFPQDSIPENVYQYYLIWVNIVEPENLRGNYDEDMARGIYHYKIGADTGIVKTMGLSKVDNHKLRDARLTNDELNQPGEFLREHYDCKLTTIGNPLFEAGKLFYIDGSYAGKLGLTSAHIIGLGGYYMTLGIEHIFEPGKYETIIEGFWQEMGTGGNVPGSLTDAENIGKSIRDKD